MRTPHFANFIVVTAFLSSLADTAALAQSNATADSPPQHIARLMTIGIDGSDPRVLFETADIQAPNWTPDGKWLVCNGTLAGSKVLIRIAADGSGQPEKIEWYGIRHFS